MYLHLWELLRLKICRHNYELHHCSSANLTLILIKLFLFLQIEPTGKLLRSTYDVKKYFEERGEVYNPAVYDFSPHKKRAIDLGLYVFTKDYKKELEKRKSLAAIAEEKELLDNLFYCLKPRCNKKFRSEHQLRIHINQHHKKLTNQHIVDRTIDETVVENGTPDAGPIPIPVAIYRTPNFEHAEQVDTFVIS